MSGVPPLDVGVGGGGVSLTSGMLFFEMVAAATVLCVVASLKAEGLVVGEIAASVAAEALPLLAMTTAAAVSDAADAADRGLTA